MLGKSGFENCKSLFLNGTEIKCEDSVKLLGVTIDYLLNFDLHVSNICKKAARQINVLLRLSKFLTIETKNLIYKSFIKSSFNFCPLVWHFCSKTSSAKMEKLQYRALRLVFNDFDSSYETLLERVNMPTLHISRIRLIAVETFKILHKMSPVYLQDLLSYKNSIFSFRYDNLVDVPRVCTTKYGKSSFCYQAAGVWNSLPNDLRKVEDLKEFKRLVNTWSGSSCKCLKCAKVNQFYFAFAYLSFFLSQFAFYLLCFALLNFYFAFISSLLCFYVNWNVFLTNIRHVFLGAQRDRLSEMVLLSTHNICFSHQYIACVEGAQKDRLIETVLLSTYSKCFWMRIKMEKMAFQCTLLSGGLIFCALSRFSSFA